MCACNLFSNKSRVTAVLSVAPLSYSCSIFGLYLDDLVLAAVTS
jgi:hypothetical protein